VRRDPLLLITIVVVRLDGVEAVDNRVLELPGADTCLEEDVHLSISPTLGLGQTEEGPHEAAEAGSCVEKGRLGAPVLVIS
jgi:hypothetical protein